MIYDAILVWWLVTIVPVVVCVLTRNRLWWVYALHATATAAMAVWRMASYVVDPSFWDLALLALWIVLTIGYVNDAFRYHEDRCDRRIYE